MKASQVMKKPFVISISGTSGSGKTTLAQALMERLGNAAVFHFDSIQADLLGRDYNAWSEAGADCNEWKLSPITDAIKCMLTEPLDYILIDYPFGKAHRDVGEYVDFDVWVDVPLDVALARRILRDFIRRDTARRPLKEETTEEVATYLDFYLARHRASYPRHEETVKPFADLVVDGERTPAETADLVIAKVKACRKTG